MTRAQIENACRLRSISFEIEAITTDEGPRWRLTIGGRRIGIFLTWHAADAERRRHWRAAA